MYPFSWVIILLLSLLLYRLPYIILNCCNLTVLQPWRAMVSILCYYKQAYDEALPHLPVTCCHLTSQAYLVTETALARMICGSLLGEHLLFLTELFKVPCWLFVPSEIHSSLDFLDTLLQWIFFFPFWQFLFYLYPGVLSLPPKYWHSLGSSLSIGIPLFFSCLGFCYVSEYSHYLP